VVALLAALLLAAPHLLPAQGEPVSLRYTPGQLNCARFVEASESKIVTQSGRREQEQSTGRTGVWRFTAQPARNGIALEGWLDSLALWRQLLKTTVRPDTDGLVGGRYHGVLTSGGSYQSRTVPFVPDEVAELADMSTALNDFLPLLPGQPLGPGQSWSDSAGLTVRRLADSGMYGVPLYRFQLEARRVSNAAPVPGDTAVIRLQQASEEQGTFVWHPSVGLIRRDRHIIIETTVPAKGLVQQPVRSRIEQRIRLVRDLRIPPSVAGRCQAA
jgi:hypothetical protein